MWALERHGAQMNATTYLNRTNYYETMPTSLLCDASAGGSPDGESNICPDALKRELRVVANEFQRGLNNPWQVINEEMSMQPASVPTGDVLIGSQFDRDRDV